MRKFLVVLVVLAIALVGGDLVAERLATSEAESRLATEGLTEPVVDVGGFPFVGQVLRREFGEVRVRATSADAEGVSASRVRMTAYDVVAPSGSDSVTAQRVTARGTVSYAEVLRQVGAEDVELGRSDEGGVRLEQDVVVLGETLTAVATGRVEPDGRRLRLVPERVELLQASAAGDAVAESLVDRLTFTYRLPQLPDGVSIRRVVPTADGFRVTLTGTDVSFETGSLDLR